MARTVLYGGTFNPIHRGHLALCRYLLDSEKFDRILLMPTASPPHKPSPQLAGGQHRLALCRMAVTGLDGITVEDWEIRQGGTSYTVDTLSYLHEKYPSDTFFLLIGSDMFLSFCQWKNWREIAKLATLLVASRTQHDREGLQAQYDLLTAQGVVIQLLENPIVELSSTEVRWEIGNTGCCKEVLPQVLQYCKDHQLYSNKYDLAALRATVQPLESPERYHHSLCVEQRAVQLAQRFGADDNTAAAAGILHDICKNMPREHLLQMLQLYDTIRDIDFVAQPQLLHSYAGAVYLRQQLGIQDDDLLNAVRYHTTGRKGMSLLEKILYLADLTSSERDYPDAAYLRECSNHSLDAGMLFALDYMVEKHLPNMGCTPCNETKDALEEYRSKIKQEDCR